MVTRRRTVNDDTFREELSAALFPAECGNSSGPDDAERKGSSSDSVGPPQRRDTAFLSLPLTVQAFLIMSIVSVVIAVSLLFRFFAVVAVDKFGAFFLDGVKTNANNTFSGLYDVMENAVRAAAENETSIVRLHLSRLCPENASVTTEAFYSCLQSSAVAFEFWKRRCKLVLLRADRQVSTVEAILPGAFQFVCNASGGFGGVIHQCDESSVLPTHDTQMKNCSWVYVGVPPQEWQPNTSHNAELRSRSRPSWGFELERASSSSRLVNLHIFDVFKLGNMSVEVRVNVTESSITSILGKLQDQSDGAGVALLVGRNVVVFPERRVSTTSSSSEQFFVQVAPPGEDQVTWQWEIRVSSGESIVHELSKRTFVVVVVAVAIGITVCIFGILLLRIVLTTLSRLKDDLRMASQLRFEGLVPRTTFLREINDMCCSFTLMAQRLQSYKPYIAEIEQTLKARSTSFGSSTMHGGRELDAPDSMSSLSHGSRTDVGDGGGDDEPARHLIKVFARYLSAKTGKDKQVVVFDHQYMDGDEELLEKFVDACKINVNCHRFEPVILLCESKEVQVQVRTTRQLEEVISSSPAELHVQLKKNVELKILSPVNLLVDLANFLLNVVLIFSVFFDAGSASTQRLSISVFTGLYFFSIVVNVFISLWILKWSQRFRHMKEWLGQASTEVSLLLLLCSLNTQHIHFLWSGWSIFGYYFNAPRHMELWKMCVRWSLFGFFFSDLMQVFYKLFRLAGGNEMLTLTGISLATACISIAMGLPKKLQFFAIARGSEEEDAGGEVCGRARSGPFQNLYSANVTLVLFRLPSVEKRSARRAAIECSAYFSSVFAHVKSNDGTILYFHGPDVLALFNAPKPTANHCRKAVRCAMDAIAAFQALHLHVYVTLTSDDMVVGYLGSQTRKNFQCLGPVDMLYRMSTFGELHEANLLATRKVMGILDSATCRWRVISMPSVEDGAVVEIRRDPVSRKKDCMSWAKLLAPFGVNRFDEQAVNDVGRFCLKWMDHDPQLSDEDSSSVAAQRETSNRTSFPADEVHDNAALADDGAKMHHRTPAFVLQRPTVFERERTFSELDL